MQRKHNVSRHQLGRYAIFKLGVLCKSAKVAPPNNSSVFGATVKNVADKLKIKYLILIMPSMQAYL